MTRAAPGKSRACGRSWRGSRLSLASHRANAATPSGTLIQKINGQPRCSATNPPITGPGDARHGEDRCEIGLVAAPLPRRHEIRQGRLGERDQPAAADALDARPATSAGIVVESAQTTDPSMQTATANRSVRRRRHDVGRLAVERRHGGCRDQVERDDPRQQPDVAERAADGWQRGRDDRLVERTQEKREQHADENGAYLGVTEDGWRAHGVRRPDAPSTRRSRRGSSPPFAPGPARRGGPALCVGEGSLSAAARLQGTRAASRRSRCAGTAGRASCRNRGPASPPRRRLRAFADRRPGYRP